MQYGFFDNESREYVVTRPDTPRPWSNYIGNAAFGGIVTNNAAGYTFYRSAAQGRLTRYKFNAVSADLNGRFLYLRDQADGDFWSQSWMPVGKPLDTFASECRHGTGYTTIRSSYRAIESTVTFFVPLGATHEVWSVSVRNSGTTPRRLKLFPFLEPQCNWSAEDDTRNLQYNQYIATTRRTAHGIDIGSNVNMPEDPEHFTNKDQARHTFFASAGIEAAGHDGDLTAFLGPYGRYAAPTAVAHGHCSGSEAYGDMPAAALEIDLALEPGETRRFALCFGVGKAEEAGRAAAATYAEAGAVDQALEAVRSDWHGRLSTLEAETPDPEFNAMLRTWAPFNNLMTFYWSRAASLVYAGERDGLGYRDTLQDIVGAAALVPEESRQRLELLLTGQYANGGCRPIVQPFHHRPGHEAQPEHYRADDGLWLFNAVPAYVKETGDLDFFRRSLPFADRGEATVLGHLRRAIEFNRERSGAHGLPCGLHADWNDCIRLGEQGESVFVALQLRYALEQYIEIARRLDEPDEAAWAEAEQRELDAALEAHAWDGGWYRRAYRFDGLPFGAAECAEGRIFMNPQAWAVLSGAATGERAATCLNAMHEHLDTEYGLRLCHPPYVTTDPAICLGRLFNPGTKENGGIFNHTQGWAVLAAARLGWGDRAYDYLRKVLPARFNTIAEIRQVEPYAVCQSTHAPESPHYGAGRVPWLSGSAVWNHVAMTDGILGIRPDYDGLILAPCLPTAWPGYTATRRFRGANYHIRVTKKSETDSGLAELSVDGQVMSGNRIPPAAVGTTVEVELHLG